jgi:hypothetical protein
MKLKIAAAVVAVAIILLLSIFVTTPHFVLSSADGVLLAHPAYEGIQFKIEFIHSVNKSPVVEFFEIRGGAIILTALEFTAFGAGMPTAPEAGQTMIVTEDGIRIENFERTISSLNYIVGHATYHVLHIGAESVPLNELAQPGTLLHITYQQLNIWQRRR